jgi:hypothetical protein
VALKVSRKLRISTPGITRKQVREVVYYANAWCDEYSGDRPYKLRDFLALLDEVETLRAQWEQHRCSVAHSASDSGMMRA